MPPLQPPLQPSRRRSLQSPLRLLARLLLPVACPCGVLDVLWCTDCAGLLAHPPVRVERGADRLDRVDGVPPIPVWALTPYAGPVRDLVVHWKDRGRTDLDRLVVPALGDAARAFGPVVADALRGARLAVVPVPSTAAARRARGREPVVVLARAVVRGLREAGVAARVVPALSRRGRGRDQVGMGVRARGRNLAGTVRMTRRGVRGLGQRSVCFLVDDVLTTGATLAAVERALELWGHEVLGATVLAATPSPARAAARADDDDPTGSGHGVETRDFTRPTGRSIPDRSLSVGAVVTQVGGLT